MKIKKGIPLIDQDVNGFYGKFGGNYIAETLKKPIDDLTKLFTKSRNDKSFIKERDSLYRKLCGKAHKIYQATKSHRSFRWCSKFTPRWFLMPMEEHTKYIMLSLTQCCAKEQKRNTSALILVLDTMEKCFPWSQKIWSWMQSIYGY